MWKTIFVAYTLVTSFVNVSAWNPSSFHFFRQAQILATFANWCLEHKVAIKKSSMWAVDKGIRHPYLRVA